jgi:hypothetical protein
MALASTWLFHVVLSMSWGPLDTGVHTSSSWRGGERYRLLVLFIAFV